MKRFLRWFLGVINDRIDCPKCKGFRTGVLIGEWGDELRECFECKHCWTVPYQPTELELDSILERRPNGGIE